MTSQREGAADHEAAQVRRAAGGDSRAFGELIRRHQDAVYAYVVRMVRDAALAEELTQDVFLKAHRRLAGFEQRAALRTWLIRIAIHHVRDYLRSRAARMRSRERDLPGEGVGGADPRSPGPTPAEEVESRELAGFFEQALAALPDALRDAFVLRHQEGLEYDELAAALGVSRANAKVRVHRARTQILAELRRRGYEV